MDNLLLPQFLPADLLLYFEVIALKELGDLSTRKDCIYINVVSLRKKFRDNFFIP